MMTNNGSLEFGVWEFSDLMITNNMGEPEIR